MRVTMIAVNSVINWSLFFFYYLKLIALLKKEDMQPRWSTRSATIRYNSIANWKRKKLRYVDTQHRAYAYAAAGERYWYCRGTLCTSLCNDFV